MIERTVKIPGVYKHFKGHYYTTVELVHNTVTDNLDIVYKACYFPYETFSRPLDEFISLVDTDKYPDVDQKYRFEEVNITPMNARGREIWSSIQHKAK